MRRPWEPEWEVDETALRGLLSEHAPALRPQRLRVLAAGWDNTAWHLLHADGEAIVRVPRRQLAVGLIEAELRWLPALAPQLPVATSAPVWGASGLRAAPWAFAAYPLVPGQDGTQLLSAGPDARTAQAIGRTLGAALARLHSLPIAVPPGSPPPPADLMGKSQVAEAPERLRSARARMLGSVPRGLLDACTALVARLAGERPRPWTHPCWVHGDLDHRHLLFDDHGALTGIIDWGDLHVGDPALDLAVWWSMLPLAARHSFQTAYGPVDAHTWRRARLRCVVHQLHVLDWATQTQKPAAAEVARRALERALRG